MADPAARKTLHEFANDEGLKNKACVDCGAPRPQWASISFAVLICLQCAGTHRGFGVHISFVRSISMDSWQEEQLRRMKLGGNAPFAAFLREYPEHGGYVPEMSPHDKYHCWAATQYRDKLTAALEGRPWTPSAAPEPAAVRDAADAPGGLRKSRASTRSPGAAGRGPSGSPGSPGGRTRGEQKAGNEGFFASLGSANAARPEHLPPSQGGRYTGFGRTASPGPGEHLSSAGAPTLGELQADPVRALSRGWSVFASAVADASRAVSENVADAELRGKVGGYVSSAGRRAAAAAGSANAWGRTQFGVDVGESVGVVVDKVRAGVSGGPPGEGYAAVGQHDEGAPFQDDEGAPLQHDDGAPFQDDDGRRTHPAGRAGAADEWDEWKEF